MKSKRDIKTCTKNKATDTATQSYHVFFEEIADMVSEMSQHNGASTMSQHNGEQSNMS